MDTPEAIFEAEIDLHGEPLLREQQRHRKRRGEVAAPVSKGGADVTSTPSGEEVDEASPLLQRESRPANQEEDGEEEGRRPSWPGSVEFAHLPWYKRPSIFWVMGPFFFMACAFGGIISPKLNLILELVCREYFSQRVINEPGFTMIPVDFNNGDNDQCRIDGVQAQVAQFTLWGNLISGTLAAIMSPRLGALSDRYGRKPVLLITSCGTLMGELITIFAAKFPETFPVRVMLLSYALDGLTGSFILAMSMSNAYATDCTPPSRRNVAFAYLHGCLFTGIAIGPILAGYLVKWTGEIVIVFYVMAGVLAAFIVFVGLFVPESLSKKRQQLARGNHDLANRASSGPEWDMVNRLRAVNLLEPLKILRPTGPGSSKALRRNLLVLAAVDTIIFGVAMGSVTVVIIYMNIQFGWKTFESGRFITIVNTCRVFCLIVVLPFVTRLVRGKPDPQAYNHKARGADRFDLAVIRTAILFDTLGYLGYTLSPTGALFVLSGVVTSLGGIGSPTLQSALTKHIPIDKTGQLLGAIGLLHALARVVAPAVFNAIYSATVASFRQAVFVCLCSTFGLAFVVSWFIRPSVYFDEDAAAEAEAEAVAASDG